VKELAGLFLTFFKLGCITFGGGYAMVPVLERELIRKRGWTSMDEVMDYYTIAQVTPGIIAVNVSTFIGFKRKGVPGGVIATIGFIMPGMLLMIAAALCLQSFAGLDAVKHAFAGIRAAVGALIVDTVIKLLKGVFKDLLGVIIFLAALALSAVWGFSPALIVPASGLIGLIARRPKAPAGKAPPPEEDRP
jgi:chromate transporter